MLQDISACPWLVGSAHHACGRRSLARSGEVGTAQVLDGTVGQVISTSGDSLVGLDSRYASPPDVQWPLTFGNMAANVMLPRTDPSYTPEVRPPLRP